VLANPLAGLEDAVIGHPWWVVAGLAALAVGCRLLDGRSATPPPGRRTSRRAAAPAGFR
jgi:hypothetical protein